MAEKRRNKKSKNNKNKPTSMERNRWGQSGIIYLIPLLIILLVVPLIVRMKLIILPPQLAALWSGPNYNPDFFSYYKGVLVIFMAVLALLVALFTWKKEDGRRIKEHKLTYGTVGIFILLIVLSTLLSPYKFLVLQGAPDRYEGLYIWLSYMVIMVYAMNYRPDERGNRIIIYTIYAFIFIITAIGISQFTGHDIFASSFAVKVIVPEEFAQYRDSLKISQFSHRSIYGTSYHYNYMGSLSALIFSFVFTMAILTKEKKLKTLSILLTGASIFLVLGSGARSGFVGSILFLMIFLILFSAKILSDWKRSLLVFLGLIIIIGGLFYAFDKNAFERIPTLVVETKSFFGTSPLNYRNEIPLKDIRVEGAHFKLDISGIILDYNNDSKAFSDESGTDLPYQTTEGKIILHDPRYDGFVIQTGAAGRSKERVIMMIQNGIVKLYFDITDKDIVPVDARLQEVDLKEADHIGFQGKERLGSARGYIWSRTLPLIFRSPILGYGSDSFLAVFPQNDIYAKLYAYDDIWMIVDKPHNLYLQIAINFGILGLLVFLALVGIFGIKIFRRYFSVAEITSADALPIACFMAVVGYLGAGFFNDSVLSVAPLFWVILGLGIALVNNKDTVTEIVK